MNSDPGSPSDRLLRAAVEVARIIDRAGNATRDARDSYRHVLSEGEHRDDSLRAGEQLLLRLGLLVETDGRLYPSAPLIVLARLDLDGAVDALRAQVHTHEEDGYREELGAAGELAVLQACVENLSSLGRDDLAAQVQQVSLVDDTLGYDIHAPSISVPTRLLEVKTSSRVPTGTFDFFLSRNEYDVGLRNPRQWFLVACLRDREAGDVSIAGWCRASSLGAYLPSDGAGRWMEARVRITKAILSPGLPPPV